MVYWYIGIGAFTHHMEHLSVVTGGEDHLGLEAGLEEEAMSRHRAASATVRGNGNECWRQRQTETQ